MFQVVKIYDLLQHLNMNKYVKEKSGGVINLDSAGYQSALRRKKQRKRLENLYKTVEDLQHRIETLEKLDK